MRMIHMPPAGSKTSSGQGSFLPAMLTTEASLMSEPMTSPDTTNAISSPGSPAGRLPSGSPIGLTTPPSGLAPARVSRFRAQDNERAMPTNDTSGPLFTVSSPSAALQSSLESRLRARLVANGSPEYALTWKPQDMPSGPPICALRASGRRISGRDCSGWPTTQARDRAKSRGGQISRTGGRRRNLDDYVKLSGWPTPQAADSWVPEKVSQNTLHRGHWNQASRSTTGSLAKDAPWKVGWATPAARDYRHPNSRSYQDRIGTTKGEQLANQVVHSGSAPNGFLASTEKRVVLNPAFSLWLMGFPAAWESCAPLETPSSRKSRPSS